MQPDLFGVYEESHDFHIPVPSFPTASDLELFLSKLTIVDVAEDMLGSQRVQPRPISPNYRILCPFHQEKTPSCVLYYKSNTYVCYGCHAAGGPLMFALKYRHALYSKTDRRRPDLVERLALCLEVPVSDIYGEINLEKRQDNLTSRSAELLQVFHKSYDEEVRRF